MPASYRIDLAKRRVWTSGTGVVTFKDFVGHMSWLSKDPQFDPSFSQLLEFTHITGFSITAEQVVELAGVRVFSPESKRAFVAPEPAMFGIARMFEAYRKQKGDNRIRVFSDYNEAVEWLDHEESVDPNPGAGPGPTRRS